METQLSKLWPHILVVLIIFGLVFHSNSTITKIKYDYEKQSKELQEINQSKLKKLEEARSTERAQLEENIKILQRDLEANRVAYTDQIAALLKKKKKEITILSEKEPVELAEVVGSATGFKVLPPVK